MRIVQEHLQGMEWFVGDQRIDNPGDPPREWRLSTHSRPSVGRGLLWWPDTYEEALGLLRNSHALGVVFDDRRYWEPFPSGWVWLQRCDECPYEWPATWGATPSVFGDGVPQGVYRFRTACVDASRAYNAPRSVLLLREWLEPITEQLDTLVVRRDTL